MKRLLLAALASLLLVPSAQGFKLQALESVRPLQVVGTDEETGANVYRNICTTTSINEAQHLWLTAAHCVGNPQTQELDGKLRFIQQSPAWVLDVNFPMDLAVVQAPLIRVPGLRMQPYDVVFGQKVYVAGHPLGYAALFLTQGWVANPRAHLDPTDTSDYMLLNVAAAPGNSGSAVLNEKGEVVSVVQVGWTPFGAMHGGAPWRNLFTFAWKYFQH
jgi:S1-C subfamily serine protease